LIVRDDSLSLQSGGEVGDAVNEVVVGASSRCTIGDVISNATTGIIH
jgi:hypothetical protein